MNNYPVIKVAIFFSGGILFSLTAELGVTTVFICGIILLILSLASIKINTSLSSLFLFLTVFLCGYIINKSQKEPYILPQHVYRIKNLTAYGSIKEIQLLKEKELTFLLEADSIKQSDKQLKQKIKFLCRIKETSKKRIDSLYNILQPGNFVELNGNYFKGREMRNPGEFDFNKYLNSSGLSGIINISGTKNINVLDDNSDVFKASIFSVRKYLNNKIKTLHNEQTAALLKGLLLADRSEIDYVTKTQFINAGVIHILAVSGLHVGFIAVVFIFLFGRFNVYLRSFLTIAGLLTFMFLTGVPPSVFRATIMAIVIITGFILNRSTNLFNSLAISALIILLLNPKELFNPGFQLSFSAVLGIAILYPPINKTINKFNHKSKFLKYLLLFMGVSLSAQIGTIPFTLVFFGKLSIIALLANLLVIPLSAVIVGLGIITLITAVVFPFLSIYYAAANDFITSIFFLIVKYSGSLSFSYISIRNFSFYDAVLFYLFLFLLFFSLKRMQFRYMKFITASIIIINFFFFSSFDNKEILSEDKLSVVIIDVGQGDAILLKFPKGTAALIDAGDVTPSFDNGERVILPLLDYLGIEKIDYAFVSHIDSDHYAGFVSLVNSGVIKKIYKPSIDTALTKDVKFEKYLSEKKIPVEYYKKEKLLIDDVPLFILNDDDIMNNHNLGSNDRSGVLKLVYGKTSFLFTGDIERKVEKIYAEKYNSFLDSDFLKTGHHGSKTSSTEIFLNYVTPELSIISAGIENKFNHPSPEVLERLENFGSEIYRTDKQGALIFESDGETISFIDWKN